MDPASFFQLQHGLGHSAITHNAMHLGEAVTLRGLAGFPVGV